MRHATLCCMHAECAAMRPSGPPASPAAVVVSVIAMTAALALLAILCTSQTAAHSRLQAARFVEVGWKFFLAPPGYANESIGAAECTRSWQATDAGLWQLQPLQQHLRSSFNSQPAGTDNGAVSLLRLVNSTLCLDAQRIRSPTLRLSRCNNNTHTQHWRWRDESGGSALVSVQNGHCLDVNADNSTILAKVGLAPCNGSAVQNVQKQSNGRFLLGPRQLCLEAVTAVPHRRQLSARVGSLLYTQATIFFQRLSPVLNNTDGPIGVVVSAGWIMDLCTEWSGDPSQDNPISNPETPQFASWTYRDIKLFFGTLRQAGDSVLGHGRLILGWMHIGSDKIYDISCGSFSRRHPEVFDGLQNGFCRINVARGISHGLAADNYTYAAFPSGLPGGTTFQYFYGQQWGALSRFLGLDLVLLRDGVGRNMYVRSGPFGFTASPNTTLNRQWRDGLGA